MEYSITAGSQCSGNRRRPFSKYLLGCVSTEYVENPDGYVGDKLTVYNAFEGYKIYKSTDRGLNWGEVMI